MKQDTDGKDNTDKGNSIPNPCLSVKSVSFSPFILSPISTSVVYHSVSVRCSKRAEENFYASIQTRRYVVGLGIRPTFSSSPPTALCVPMARSSSGRGIARQAATAFPASLLLWAGYRPTYGSGGVYGLLVSPSWPTAKLAARFRSSAIGAAPPILTSSTARPRCSSTGAVPIQTAGYTSTCPAQAAADSVGMSSFPSSVHCRRRSQSGRCQRLCRHRAIATPDAPCCNRPPVLPSGTIACQLGSGSAARSVQPVHGR